MDWKEHFSCDEQGVLVWKVRDVVHFPSASACGKFNSRIAGSVAGSKQRYKGGKRKCIKITISIRGKAMNFKAHRIVWEMHHGPIPDGVLIDHANGDPWDNSLSNLRLASNAENCRNAAVSKNCRSGMKGAYWNNRDQRWRSAICVNRKRIQLGSFATADEAHAAYCNASQKFHGDFSRTQ